MTDPQESDRGEPQTPAVEIGVLGPLTLRIDGVDTAVTGARRRALLAVLAMAGPHGVTTMRLVDSLWDEQLPADPTAALHNLVSRLRRHFGRYSDVVERRPAGYRLVVPDDAIDAAVVRELVTTATTASDPEIRLRLTRRALGLWRGQPLGEFSGVADLDAERVALEELRSRLDDVHLDAMLETGGPGAAAAAKDALAAAPLRESTARILIRALAAEGNTAEAMAAAAGFRVRLAEETGLDPSPALAVLEEQVAAGGLPAVQVSAGRASGPMSAASGPRRPPRPDGPFVGRERERAELTRLLTEHRLLTLTGTGGVGKTRLALEIAGDPTVLTGHTVHIIDLAAVVEPEGVGPAVASTLGLDPGGNPSAASGSPEVLAHAIPGGPMLLVLDNCEHVLAACREVVVALLRGAPEVRILATSRVVLQLSAEYVVRLQPLPTPREACVGEQAMRQPAVRAFIEHARRRVPDFVPAEHDLATVGDIVHRVDGLPLGIELAARQAATMPLDDVARVLDTALDLATGRGHDDRRQQTLRVSLDMSFHLLSAPDRELLTSLAIFPGGVTLRTFGSLARHVSGDGRAVDPAMEPLHRLVDSSLLVADPLAGRYRLLYLVRQFLLDRLRESGGLDAAEDLLLTQCVLTAREIDEDWLGPEEPQANRRLHAELDNFRAARDVALACGRIDELVSITTSLSLVSIWRNIHELWMWAIELAESPEIDGHVREDEVLAAAAEAARLTGRFDLALNLAGRAVDASTSAGRDPNGAAYGASAAVAHFRGDYAVAAQRWSAAADLDSRVGAAYLASSALAIAYGGDRRRAARVLAEAGDRVAADAGGSQHAFLDYVQGELVASRDPATALALYQRAEARAEAVGATFVLGVARVGAASCLAQVGDRASAAQAYRFLLRFWRDSGQPTQLWTTARNAASLLRAVGRREIADLLLSCAELDPAASLDGPRNGDDAASTGGGMAAFVSADDVIDRALRELGETVDELEPGY
ncbi:BTAD domain-containing putative transcriptional regulator [Gordonia westfalica]|uniref:Predicted ATPase n=1 Tax=Gordonia westfalica TaxID=158898 RepID=A0A1H2JEB9_9ACTN|nr:BTAD domain-containing putative transcriptional regulator [Gordonia westfalica]SDU54723.1 Predicted ATPase [Gordonia westfalica]